MTVLNWKGTTIVGVDVVIDWGSGVEVIAPPLDIEYHWLHAGITSTLFHAEATAGESTPVSVDYNLVDESGNRIVDQSGNQIIVPASEASILLHARATETLFHAEA